MHELVNCWKGAAASLVILIPASLGLYLFNHGPAISPRPRLMLPTNPVSDGIHREKEQAPKIPESEKVLATYPKTFTATLYYTPIERGFTAEAGFDVTPETRPGLNGEKLPRDFLKAVQLEGFGRLEERRQGKDYIRYAGTWQFVDRPIGSHDEPLEPKKSAAIAKQHGAVKPGAKLKIDSETIHPEVRKVEWQVTDRGSGLKAKQIDLYWGESEPKGPGKQMTHPKDAPAKIADPTVKVIE